MSIQDARLGSIFGLSGGSPGLSRAQFCPGMGHADVATSGSMQQRVTGYFNGAAFCTASAPQINGGTGFGNSGQGIILGPRQNNWDISVNKSTRVGGLNEKAVLEFRAEFFNAFNHPQFASPSSAAQDVGNARFGVITRTSVNPRLIQFALKYRF